MRDWFWITLVVLAFGLFLFWMGCSVATEASTRHRCLRAGWPDTRVTWNFERYCVRRVDQTDIVKPLSEVEAHP